MFRSTGAHRSSLTRGAQYRSDPQRPDSSFFRVITTDTVQAAYAADYAVADAVIARAVADELVAAR